MTGVDTFTQNEHNASPDLYKTKPCNSELKVLQENNLLLKCLTKIPNYFTHMRAHIYL